MFYVITFGPILDPSHSNHLIFRNNPKHYVIYLRIECVTDWWFHAQKLFEKIKLREGNFNCGKGIKIFVHVVMHQGVTLFQIN